LEDKRIVNSFVPINRSDVLC